MPLMRTTTLGLAILFVVATANAVAAQPSEGAPAPPPAQPTPSPAQPTPPPAQPAQPLAQPAQPVPTSDTADVIAAYDQAFAALLAGEFQKAAVGFRAVAARSVEADRRAASRELARLADGLIARGAKLRLKSPGQTAPATRAIADDDQPDAGRAGFIVTTTLASTYAGVYLLDILNTSDFRAAVLVITGTTAAGFIGSLYGSSGKTITAGTADAYSLGISMGVGNALLLAFPLGLDSSTESVQTTVIGGMVLGGVAGMIMGDRARPTRAQVGFTGTTATLGLATAGLGLVVAQPDTSADTVLLVLAGGLDAGAGLGLGLAGNLDWSPGRQRLTSLGAFLGALAGWATAALLTGTSSSGDTTSRAWAGSTLVGMWGGFGLSTYLTRHMKPDPRFAPAKPTVEAQVAPMLIGHAPGLAISGSW